MTSASKLFSRRLLVINPNTNSAVTERIRAEASRVVRSGTLVSVTNPLTGPFSIETQADRAEAEPAVVRLVSQGQDEHFDAFVLACFDDIALSECRSIAEGPVISTCEAGIAAARKIAKRFSIITTVHSAVPGIHRLLDRYGVSDICTVRAAGIGVAAAAETGGEADLRILSAIEDAIAHDGAEAILLGSGGLTGRARELGPQFNVPILDGVSEAIKKAQRMAVDIHRSPASD